METGTLIAHVDTEKIDRQALALIPTPPGTETHRQTSGQIAKSVCPRQRNCPRAFEHSRS